MEAGETELWDEIIGAKILNCGSEIRVSDEIIGAERKRRVFSRGDDSYGWHKFGCQRWSMIGSIQFRSPLGDPGEGHRI